MNLNKIDKIVVGFLIFIFIVGGFGKGAILTIIPFAFIYYIMRDNILKVFGLTNDEISKEDKELEDLNKKEENENEKDK